MFYLVTSNIWTPTPAVLGECGRERLHVTCIIKCVKYWLRIISLPAESLSRSCYSVMYNRCHLGKTNWAVKLEISCTAMALVGYGKTSMSQIQQLL